MSDIKKIDPLPYAPPECASCEALRDALEDCLAEAEGVIRGKHDGEQEYLIALERVANRARRVLGEVGGE